MDSEKTAEGVRCREMALEKMRESDFISGRRLAIEAQKLCPTMEDIDRMILVCNVHCSAADGKDWYKILDVSAEADEATVRSRCGRMSICLHPDRNRFPGAAEAFQLMVEAKAVLLDNEKRRVYDSMCREKAMDENWGFSRFSGDGVGEGFQSGFSRFRKGCESEIGGFQLPIDEQSGSAGFRSVEEHNQQGQIGQASVENRPNFSRGRGWGRGKKKSDLSKQTEGVINLDVCSSRFQSDQPCGENRPNSSRDRGRGRGRSRESKLSKKSKNESNSNEKVVNIDFGSSRFDNNQPNDENGFNCSTIRETTLSKVSKIQGLNGSNEHVLNLDSCSSRSHNDQSSGENRPSSRGRGRGRESKLSKQLKNEGLMMNSSKEYVVNLDVGSSIVHNDHSEGENRPKSSTIRGSKSSKIEGLMMNMVNLDSRLPNDEPSSRNRPNVRGRGRGRGPNKRSKKEKRTNEITPDSSILEYKDAEFNDFEKQRCIEAFAAGQIWAVYDTLDAMPRFYALINEVSSDHRVRITWLEPLPNNEDEKEWLHQGLPACCGRFKHGYNDVIKDHAVFSHLVKWESVKNVYAIHPKKGETWAVFKNWDGNPLKFNSFECEVVEILSDFNIVFGVSVALLRRIEGFCCVFGKKLVKGVDWEVIKGKDRLRFSHRIPSVPVLVNNGVKSYFELDPASLPPNIDAR